MIIYHRVVKSAMFPTVSFQMGWCVFKTPFLFLILQELQKHGNPGIIMVLVGNKADLHESRSVPSQV
jgi:hypothetical protein